MAQLPGKKIRSNARDMPIEDVHPERGDA